MDHYSDNSNSRRVKVIAIVVDGFVFANFSISPLRTTNHGTTARVIHLGTEQDHPQSGSYFAACPMAGTDIVNEGEINGEIN